jgi:hypothetical protein
METGQNGQNAPKKHSKILKWSLILSIIIVLNLFYNVSLDLIFDRPQYDEFCATERITKSIQDEQQCLENGGSWTQYQDINITPLVENQPTGYCDQNYTCRAEFDSARDNYEKKVFISLVTLGLITFIVSLIIKSNVVLSSALAIAVVLNFVIASMRYWSSAEELLKVLILAIALAILFYISIKKFNDYNDQK